MPSEGFSDGIFALFTVILKSRHSHAGRNLDENPSCQKYPNRQEYPCHHSRYTVILKPVIPAQTEIRICPRGNFMRRHSREGGNPDRSVSVISDKFLLLFIPRFPLSRE
ncbi:TPA: hypothetical protein ACSIGF_000910 [Neisseria gonorrhoeae]